VSGGTSSVGVHVHRPCDSTPLEKIGLFPVSAPTAMHDVANGQLTLLRYVLFGTVDGTTTDCAHVHSPLEILADETIEWLLPSSPTATHEDAVTQSTLLRNP
jgi:hypothetical protein